MELGPLMRLSARQGETILHETLNLYYRHLLPPPPPLGRSPKSHPRRPPRTTRGRHIREPATRGRHAGRRTMRGETTHTRLAGSHRPVRQNHHPPQPRHRRTERSARLRARDVRIWDNHEGTINLTAKLDALDAHYVNATGHTCGTITVPTTTLQPRVQIYTHLTAHNTGTSTRRRPGRSRRHRNHLDQPTRIPLHHQQTRHAPQGVAALQRSEEGLTDPARLPGASTPRVRPGER